MSYTLAKEIIAADNYDTAKVRNQAEMWSLQFPRPLSEITGKNEVLARNYWNRINILELGWEGWFQHLEDKAKYEEVLVKIEKSKPIDDDISDDEDAENEEDFDKMLEDQLGLSQPNKNFYKPIMPLSTIDEDELDDMLSQFGMDPNKGQINDDESDDMMSYLGIDSKNEHDNSKSKCKVVTQSFKSIFQDGEPQLAVINECVEES